ncbi:MAG: 6-carboxytetrahydropterin synthase QueD [Gammaproteobacteria bacterium]|nr:MAG: 6-carboxytetrahydropterin synthase QueD [Gammaproteobacteria bacterium]
MPAEYTLKILTDFAAAHTLREYPGACSRMHGHNWKIEAEVRASQLDEIGMGIDFKTIRKTAKEIAAKLDHQYLNDIQPFDTINPTAENIAAWFFDEMKKVLENDRIKVHAITLWETDRACVRYSED